MTSSSMFPIWTSEVPITFGGRHHVDYKYAVFSGGKFCRWENFDGKRTVVLPHAGAGEMGDALKRQVTINDVLDELPVLVSLAVLDSARIERAGSTSGSARGGDGSDPTSTDYQSDSSMEQPTLSFDLPALTEHAGLGSEVVRQGRGRMRSASDNAAAMFKARRDGLMLVSRYLPITISKATGEWVAEWDEERLLASKKATGTEHISKRMRCVWIGGIHRGVGGNLPRASPLNPGNPAEREGVVAALERISCVPVFLDPVQERNSEKFSRTSLWPALHNVLPVFGKKSTSWFDREVPEALWRGFTELNKSFAQKVVEVYDGADDLIWINDYHLMLLPTFLAHKIPSATIGIFIHTPWPSSEIFRTLSFRTKVRSSHLSCASLVRFVCSSIRCVCSSILSSAAARDAKRRSDRLHAV